MTATCLRDIDYYLRLVTYAWWLRLTPIRRDRIIGGPRMYAPSHPMEPWPPNRSVSSKERLQGCLNGAMPRRQASTSTTSRALLQARPFCPLPLPRTHARTRYQRHNQFDVQGLYLTILNRRLEQLFASGEPPGFRRRQQWFPKRFGDHQGKAFVKPSSIGYHPRAATCTRTRRTPPAFRDLDYYLRTPTYAMLAV